MRKRILLGVCLLMLLEGCSSSQQNKPYGSVPATPGITGNAPPVGPAHPVAGVPAPFTTQGGLGQTSSSSYPPGAGPATLAALAPSSAMGGPVITNKPGSLMARTSPPTSGGMPPAFGSQTSTGIDARVVNATWAESGPSVARPIIVPTAGTTTREPERSDLLYATTAAIVPPPPATKEPAPIKEPAFTRDLPLATEAFKTTTTVPVTAAPTPVPGPIPPAPGVVPTAEKGDTETSPGRSLALRTVGTRKFTLAFEMKDATSGAAVEVWATQDQKHWVKIPSNHLPPSTLTVEAPGEGTYGLLLQVRTGTNPSRSPRTGDTPHIWVAVDTTKPTIEMLGVDLSLTSKSPGLVVRWKAADRNFGPRPITISYAETTEGPWIPLGTNINNSGRHEIPVPAHMPRKMLVRIDATDVAGNVGSVQTPQPIRIELPWPPPANEVVAKPTPPPVVQPEPIRPTISVVDLAPSN